MKTIIALVSIIVIISIGFNVFVIKQFNKTDKNDQRVDLVRNEYGTSKLPIKVLKNIASQEITDDLDKEKKLVNAYTTNLKKLVNNFDVIEAQLIEIQKDFGLSKTQNIQQKVEKCRVELDEVLYIMKNKYSLSINRNLKDIEELEAAHYHLEACFLDLDETYNQVSKTSRNSLFIGMNFIVLFLISLTLLIASVGIRFINLNLIFMMGSYKQLEEHDYNFNHLPEMKTVFNEEKIIYNTVKKIFLEQEYSTEFKDVVIRTYMMDELIDLLFKKVEQSLKVDRIGIAFVDYKKGTIVAEYGVANYGSLILGPGFEVPIHETSLAKIIDKKTGVITNDLEFQIEKKSRSKALKSIIDEGIKSNMVVPLIMSNTVFGFIFFSSTQKNNFNEDQLRLVSKLMYEIDGFLNRSYLTKVVFSKIAHTFAELVDKKDNDTGGHIVRMVKYSVVIAEGLKAIETKGYEIDKRTILDIERNASVHDIGKVGVPDSILKKPGKLTPGEWEVMKKHTSIGGDIFKNMRESLNLFDYDFYEAAEYITRYHHERWDGTGYPEGLKGEEIPLVARIVALADVFDALASERVYKKAFSFEESIGIIRESRGNHLDPIIVDTFLTNIEEIRTIYDENNEKEAEK